MGDGGMCDGGDGNGGVVRAALAGGGGAVVGGGAVPGSTDGSGGGGGTGWLQAPCAPCASLSSPAPGAQGAARSSTAIRSGQGTPAASRRSSTGGARAPRHTNSASGRSQCTRRAWEHASTACVPEPSWRKWRESEAAQHAAESASRWSQKASMASGCPLAAAHCSRHASSDRKASPVDSAAWGCLQSGTEPSPTALSQWAPSAPRPSRIERPDGQRGRLRSEAAHPASERSSRVLPLPVAPTIMRMRQPAGHGSTADEWPSASRGHSSSVGTSSAGTRGARFRRVVHPHDVGAGEAHLERAPPRRPARRPS